MSVSKQNLKYNLIAIVLSLLGFAYVVFFIFKASTNVVASDYIRIINYYIEDVTDLKYLLSWESISRIPFTFLMRFINVKLFSYSVFFDKVVGIVGLFIVNFITVKFIFENIENNVLKILASVVLTFITFSLSAWEMILNGTGYPHFITIGLIAITYYLLSSFVKKSYVVSGCGNIENDASCEGSGSRDRNNALYSDNLKINNNNLSCNEEKNQNIKINKFNVKQLAPYILIILVSVICFLIYNKSNNTGVPLVPVGFKKVTLFEVLRDDALFPIRFLLKSLAGSIIGSETINQTIVYGIIDDRVVLAMGVLYILIILWTLYIIIKTLVGAHQPNLPIDRQCGSKEFCESEAKQLNVGAKFGEPVYVGAKLCEPAKKNRSIYGILLLIIITTLIFAGSYAVAFEGTVIFISLIFIIEKIYLNTKFSARNKLQNENEMSGISSADETNVGTKIECCSLAQSKMFFPCLYIIYGMLNYLLVFLARFQFVEDTYGMSSRYSIQYMFLSIGIIIALFIYLDDYVTHKLISYEVNSDISSTEKSNEEILKSNENVENNKECSKEISSNFEDNKKCKYIYLNKKVITLKNIITVLISILCIFVLWFGNVATSTDEIYKAPVRKLIYTNLENVALNYKNMSDEELMTYFEYFRGGDHIRNAMEILKSQGLNVFQDVSKNNVK